MFSRAKQKKVNTIISSLLLPKLLKKEPDSVHEEGRKPKLLNKAVKHSEQQINHSHPDERRGDININ